MTGDHDKPQNLSLARTSLHCSHEAGDVGVALPVGFSDKMLNRSLEGYHSDLSFDAKDGAAFGHLRGFSGSSAYPNADTLLRNCRC